MFTTCPKCSLKLVVTAADLRVAQGYVRCGRCSNVFNALAGLSDEQQAVLAREPAAAAQPPDRTARASTAPQAPAAHQPSGAAPTPPQAEEPIPEAALEFDPSSTDVSEVFIEAPDDDPTGTFESIVLRTEELLEGTWSEHDDEARVSSDPRTRTDSEPATTGALDEDSETHEFEVDLEALVAIASTHSRPEVAKQQAPAAPEPKSSNLAPPRAAVREPARQAEAVPLPPEPSAPALKPEARPTHEARGAALATELYSQPRDATALEEDEGVDRRFNIERALTIGSVALAVLLVLQIVNHERAELAGLSWLQAPLKAVYSALGVPLAPHWNVHAYEVRQFGAVVSNPGALTVRASVKNTAPREQPLPLLRVTMQDRFGNRIAARDVPPSAYLPAGSSDRSDLAAGQRVDAEIAFADPGPNAVGFEIDACLELASGRVACANDAGAER